MKATTVTGSLLFFGLAALVVVLLANLTTAPAEAGYAARSECPRLVDDTVEDFELGVFVYSGIYPSDGMSALEVALMQLPNVERLRDAPECIRNGRVTHHRVWFRQPLNTVPLTSLSP